MNTYLGRWKTWLGAVAAFLLSGIAMGQTSPTSNFAAANLNGAASFTLPTVTTLGGAITIEGWVYPRSHALWQRIVDIGNGSGVDNLILGASQSTSGKPIFELWSGSGIVISIVAPNALPLNTWTHVAGVLDDNLAATLYINGQAVATGTATALPPTVNRTSALIGKSNWPDALLDGSLGDVRIWNTARTQAQIQAGMAAGSITGPTTGLVAGYPFGSTGASPLSDVSGNNLHLTAVGAVNYSGIPPGTAPNNNFVSANLNGAASYAIPAFTLGGAMTIEGWVYAKTHALHQRIVDIGNGPGSENLILAASDGFSGKPAFTLFSGPNPVVTVMAPNAIPLNTWNHVAAVVDSSRATTLYINGQAVATGTATALPPTVSRGFGFIGKSNWGADALLNGSLGDVRIWSVARTQAQIQASMAAGSITGPTSGLVLAYPFGVTGASAVSDISGNDLHLTQVGTVNYSKTLSGSLATAGFRGASSVGVAAGTLAITGTDNDYTGTTTVASGTTYSLGNGGTTGTPGSGEIANGGAVVFNRSNALTVGNLISGAGTVTQSGTGTTTLTNANTYTGMTTVAAGILEVLARVALSTAPYTVSAGATLRIGYDTGTDYNNPPITVHGAGVASNAGLQVLVGKTLISNAGILLDTAPSTIRAYGGEGVADLRGFDVNGAYFLKTTAAASGSVVDSAVRLWTVPYGYKVHVDSGANTATGDLVVRSRIHGSLGLIKVGPGRLVISGPNTYTGFTTINEGTLQVGEGGTSGNLVSTTVSNGSALVLNRSDTFTVPGAISGTGTLTQSGAGTTIPTGANSYSGATTISAGTLQVGNGGTTGTLGGGSIVNNAALAYDRSDAATVSSVISGTGTLAKRGAGTLTLSALNTFTGGTTVEAGTLALPGGGANVGNIRGSVTVASGATLQLQGNNALGWGAGTKVNTVNINGGLVDNVASGDQGWGIAYRMTGGELRSNGGTNSTTTGSLFTPGGGTTITTLASPSTAVISGRLQLRDGNVDDSLLFDVADGAAAVDLLVSAAITQHDGARQVTKGGLGTMVFTGTGTYAGTTTINGGRFQVGDGGTTGAMGPGSIFNNAALAWNRSDAFTVANAISGTGSIEKLGAGTLTLSGNSSHSGVTTVSAGTLRVGNGGASGSLGTGAVVNNATLAWNRSDAITVANVISGTGSIAHEGSGTLTLTGANTYTGTTTIGAGTLSVGAGGASGALGTGDISVAGTLLFNSTATLSVPGLISGAGVVRKMGSGTVVLAAVGHSYSGLTTVEAGTLEVLGRSAGNTAPYTVSAGGTLKIGYDTGADYGNPPITVHGAGVASQAGLQVMGGRTLISNPGILLDTAPSTIRAYGTGNATLRGFDVNSAYFLKTTAAASGSVVDGGVGVNTGLYGYKVHADSGANTATGDLILRGVITGTPGLFKVGAGRLVISGNNTYAGTTTISAGTLQVGEGGTSGTLGSGAVSNSGSLVLNRSDALSIPGVISGSGSLVKTGAGTATLTAASTYTGATTISAGTLALSGSGALSGTPSITLSSGTTLDVSGRSSALSLGSGQALSVSSGTATLRGNVSVGSGRLGLVPSANGSLSIASGTLTLSASTTLEVTVSGSALAAGSYKLVSKGTGGVVAGTVPSVTVQGAGIASGTQAALAIVSDELVLEVKLAATVALSNLAQRFDGTAKTPTATTTPAGLPVTFTYNGSATAPSAIGSYALVATVNSPTHFGSATGTLVIQKGLAQITLGNVIQTYDGTQRRATATTVPANLNVTFTYDGSATLPVNVGRYTVVATVNDALYEGSATGRLIIVSGNAGKGPPPNPLPPTFLNYQGFVVGNDGQPVGSPNPRNVRLIFRIYASSTGGAPLWAEEHVTVVDQGQYSVVLGEGNPLGTEPWPELGSVFMSGSSSSRYMQVTGGGLGAGGSDLTIMPRVLMPPVPYAFLARHAQSAGRLLNASNQPVLQVSGQSVGILTSNPGAALDVGGDLAASTLRASANGKVGGTVKAARIVGRGIIPVGGIVAWTGSVPPTGWALCDGQVANGLRTPDLRGRFVLGLGNGAGLTERPLGQVGGLEAVALSWDQMPSHQHTFNPAPFSVNENVGHQHDFFSGHGSWYTTRQYGFKDGPLHAGREPTPNPTSEAGAHAHEVRLPAFETSRAGNGQPHSTMPPFYVMAFIMRVQ